MNVKRLHKFKPVKEIQIEPKIHKTLEIDLHNLFSAGSIAEAHGYAKSIFEDFDKLLKLEQKGKIRSECGCDSPSFMFVYVLDKSVLPELRKIRIVSTH